MKKIMRLLLCGGGTAGHVLPHQAVVEALEKAFSKKNPGGSLELLYIGSKTGPERQWVESWGWNYRVIPVGKWRRYGSWRNFTDPFRVLVGILKSFWIVGQFSPDVAFSKGGFASVSVLVACWLWRVPIVIHDSDAIPGLTTRLTARFAHTICLGYAEAAKIFPQEKTVITGIPVRSRIQKGDAKRALKSTGLSPHKKTILVMGGSLGSKHLNEALWNVLSKILKHAQVVHITGWGKEESSQFLKNHGPKSGYKVMEFSNEDLPDLYALADVVVTRAGANSIAELQVLQKPMIVVPLGKPASHGDQIENARLLKAQDAAVVILDEELTGERLLKELEPLLKDPQKRHRLEKNAKTTLHQTAAKRIAESLLGIIKVPVGGEP